MQFRPVFYEDESSIRNRLLAAVPSGLATVEGTFARDILEMGVLEFARLWDELNFMVSQTFPQWASGDLLDAHALSFGLLRGTGVAATGSVRFTGEPGIVIPTGVVLAVPNADPDVPRVEFLVSNTTSEVIPAAGWLDLDIEAVEVGVDGNVNAGAVVAISGTQVTGLTGLTNPYPTFGGEDPENDEALRARVLAEAALPTGSGTELDYERWGREVAGVSEVAAKGNWDTSGISPPATAANGTVQVSLRGPAHVPVGWDVVQSAQKHLDPGRQVISIFEENEGWSNPLADATESYESGAGEVQSGFASYTLLLPSGAGATVVSLDRRMDLSRFADEDEFYLWTYASDWSKYTNTSYVRFYVDDSNYFACTQATQSSDGVVRPTTSSGWWLWRPSRGSFSATGAPTWDAITRVEVSLARSATFTARLDYWTIRSKIGAAGRGRAPVGAAVTVVSPVSKPITVTAVLVLADGYTLTGTLGTTNVTGLIEAGLTEYLASVKPGDPVRFAGVANVLHDTPGVTDFSSLSVTSGALTADVYGETIPATLHEYPTLSGTVLS
jgi:uncharacterized phage protein gp47/JayE